MEPQAVPEHIQARLMDALEKKCKAKRSTQAAQKLDA
jgi:hypothetical protein